MKALNYLLVALLVIAGTGCNVFEGMNGTSLSDDLDDLLFDADIALQQDRAEHAISILRHANDLYPEAKQVNIKLSTALLEHNGIGVREALVIARVLTTSGSPASREMSAVTAEGGAPICSFPDHHESNSFDLKNIESFADFDPSTEALNEIQDHISAVLEIENEETEEFDQEETIEAVIDRLRDEENLSDDAIAEIMLNDAVATMTAVYLDLSEDARETYEFYYVTSPADEEYLGYCAPTQAKYDEAETTAACRADDVSWVNSLINKRVDLLDSSNSIAEEIAGYSSEVYEIFTRELDATCNS